MSVPRGRIDSDILPIPLYSIPYVAAIVASSSGLTKDVSAQGMIFAIFPIILVIAGLILIIIGITTAGGGCVGTGLMWVGGGIIVGDFGGFVMVKNPYVLVAGGAGFVILLIGAALRAFVTC